MKKTLMRVEWRMQSPRLLISQSKKLNQDLTSREMGSCQVDFGFGRSEFTLTFENGEPSCTGCDGKGGTSLIDSIPYNLD